MDSFQESRRQIRIALVGIVIILLVGVVGFMLIEKMSPIESLWFTVVTLSTIGYGDIQVESIAGRTFTIFLILIGLGVVGFGLQAAATFMISPAVRDLRQNRRIQSKIDKLENHYIICGVGELVDRTIGYVLHRAESHRQHHHEQTYKPVDDFLDRIFGDDAEGHYVRLRGLLHRMFLFFVRLFKRSQTLLDVVVVITTDSAYADRLRHTGLLVVKGEPTDDAVLEQAGIRYAQAIMVMLDDDTETLFATLTAHSHNPNMHITAATLEEELTEKMTRAGANSVIAPYDVAGNFLNNATLRPAVNDFFNSILFDQISHYHANQLHLPRNSPWVGQRLGNIQLRERFNASVIGLRRRDGHFLYVPDDNHRLQQNEVLVIVAPLSQYQLIQDAGSGNIAPESFIDRHRLMLPPMDYLTSKHSYTLDEAEVAIQEMADHFVICGSGRIARNAINKLNPERPFVIISDDEHYTTELLRRGFRVIQGAPTHEKTLLRAGVNRAQAIMVAIENKADRVLTVLISRSLSDRILITATAGSDDMRPKLLRAGADRVVRPFHTAAQFVLLATTAPVVNDFLQYVLFNYQVGLETTELYMEDDSPWIGKTVGALQLVDQFQAGVIGIRKSNGSYIYAPPNDYVIKRREVLIVITPMEHSDELRESAHGSQTKRPRTLRSYDSLSSGILSRDFVNEIMAEREQKQSHSG